MEGFDRMLHAKYTVRDVLTVSPETDDLPAGGLAAGDAARRDLRAQRLAEALSAI